ncbi:Bifunctional protein HldE [Methanimicrococcus sp. At1]|uniref:FAD synthase n=1 Tax=Methanimicrococcus hacksteinii TaxID=3028293 RepID=A0ABU3VNQ8_9EURY|nr:adenylyltransferase/cytidyltransferase family protein [Methanimicrococcus sp. At1]MDV0445027.1 Bifunctional protein HldE [Methanimicrococcus sp. At1]
MTRVLATGTFDILHPGHVYFLEQAKALGDELYVIISRDVNVNHKPRPVVPEDQRLKMVASLRPVDSAVLGSLTDYFEPIAEIKPDIVVLGFDQKFQEAELKKALNGRGFFPEVVRLPQISGEFYSSRAIAAEIAERKKKHLPID